MRRVVLAALAALGAGCASMGSPPGGPQRTTPPEIKSVTPDSGTVNFHGDAVVFEFDEVVNERSGPGGQLDGLVLISPREGAPRVTWKRNRIEVRPRGGFKPNTAYSVTLLPGLNDLRNNVMKEGRTVVFSTGATMPTLAIHGVVFDWLNERPAGKALIDVIRRPDSLPYIGVGDSTGQFVVGPLGPGRYTVRAMLDNNGNKSLDKDEPWDSTTVTLTEGGSSPFLELLAAPRDTVPPRLLTVSIQDTLHLLASFDRPLDPATPLSAASFKIARADSSEIRIVSVTTRAKADSIAQAAAADSAAKRDTSAAARDTAALKQLAAAVRQVARPSRPAPPRDIVVTVNPSTPIKPGSAYRVTAMNVRGLSGLPRTSDRTFTMPVARADTTRRTVRP